MGWVALALVVGGAALLLFVVLTDGRYFGKAVVYQIYNRLGPAIFTTRSEAPQWQALARSLELDGGEWILDVGTAAGDLPLSIAGLPGFHGQVVGVDWSPRMIAVAQGEAKRRGVAGHATFQVVDLREGLPFAAGAFDVLFCLGLLETLPQPERVLEELRRVVQAEGVMVFSLYRGWSTGAVALSQGWYEEHLGRLGAAEVQVIACRSHHDALVARFGGGEANSLPANR